MYSFNKQIHPPTVVEHSIYCNFYNDDERNLIVGGGNDGGDIDLSQQLINKESINELVSTHVKLECQQTFDFCGEITSINHVRLNKSVRDSILITFMDAKLSIVEYDPNIHNLRTLSMNYFEDNEFNQGYVNNSIHQPIVRCDPDSRCCAMFIYGRNIIIVPFKSENAADEHVDQIQSIQEVKQAAKIGSYSFTYPSLKNIILPAYKLDLQDKNFSGEKINNIIDIQFLEGYYEPSLLILYEPIRTWAGRIAVRQDTCAMIALSLNVHQKVHPIIWSTNNLPFDSQYVLPVPRPIGGVLIFCTNILIYLNQSVPPFAVSLNSFAESSSAFPVQPQKNIKISLDCSRACFISNDKLVISLKEGEIYVVTLFIDRMRSVKRFHIEKAASTVLSSCITFCGKDYLFLGSRLGNSLLLKYTDKVVNIQPKFFEDKSGIDSETHLKPPHLTNGNSDENDKDADKEMDVDSSHHDDKKESNIDTEQDKPTEENCKTKDSQEVISSFVNDNLDKNNLYDQNEFIFKEQPEENYKKRKIDEIEFDDEDKELYGEDDPIFHEDDRMIQLHDKLSMNAINTNITIEDSSDLYADQQDEELSDKENNQQQQPIILNEQKSNQEDKCVEIDNEEENLKNLLNDNGQNDDLELYNEADNINEQNKSSDQQRTDDKNGLADWMAGNVNLLKDDDLEIFGPDESDNDKLPITLIFNVCDSIINIGPCSRICMGELSFLSDELEKENDHEIELVTTSGYGKNGALCVLQRTIRPQIVTTYVIPKCLDMWTVYSSQKDIDFADNATNDPSHHAYLILSRDFCIHNF